MTSVETEVIKIHYKTRRRNCIRPYQGPLVTFGNIHKVFPTVSIVYAGLRLPREEKNRKSLCQSQPDAIADNQTGQIEITRKSKQPNRNPTWNQHYGIPLAQPRQDQKINTHKSKPIMKLVKKSSHLRIVQAMKRMKYQHRNHVGTTHPKERSMSPYSATKEKRENMYWDREIEAYEKHLNSGVMKLSSKSASCTKTTPFFWHNPNYEAALSLTDCLFPRHERENLYSAISILRLEDIKSFKEMFMSFKSKLQREVTEMSEVINQRLEELENVCRNYVTNPEPSQAVEADESSQANPIRYKKSYKKRIHGVRDQQNQGNRFRNLTSEENHRFSEEKCGLCWKTHHIWQCKRLNAMRAEEKTKFIQALNLCCKCLSKHRIGEWQSSGCPYCNGPHHILLCYKRENHQRQQFNERN